MATTNSNRKGTSRSARSTRSTATKKTPVKKTGGKTKSTVKATTKVAAKTTVKTAKTTAKTVKADRALKTASVKTSAAGVRAPLTPLEKIRNLHVTKAIVYLLGAGLVLGLAKTAAVAMTLGISARDEFASRENTVLTPAYEVLYNIEPKYLLALSLVLAALASLLLATKWRNRYETTLANRISGFRWVAVGISAALLLTYINMLVGIHDEATLKMSAGLIFVTTMLSWLAERDNSLGGAPKRLAYWLSLLAGTLAWLPLIGSLIGTTLFGEERFGWHVYALAGVVLAGFIGFALNQYRHLRAGAQRDYLPVEERYIRIDLLMMFFVVLITLLAFQ